MRRNILLAIPVALYLYILYLCVVMFIIPAFTAYFALHGVVMTFVYLITLTLGGGVCGVMFAWALSLKGEQSC